MNWEVALGVHCDYCDPYLKAVSVIKKKFIAFLNRTVTVPLT